MSYSFWRPPPPWRPGAPAPSAPPSYATGPYKLLFRLFFFFFFSVFHQRADDEALTRLLQTSLFLVASPFLVKPMFLSFRPSLTLSIQVFLYLPLLLFPSTCPCKAAFGNLFPSVRSTCPNHCSLLFLIF